MPPAAPFTIRRLTSSDIALMEKMMTLLGAAFGEPEIYTGARPSRAYLERLLGSDEFIALAALVDDAVVGGLAAYVLTKFEQERSEVFIYDLAVAEAERRKGIATALIEETCAIAKARGAYLVIVQAEKGDEPAAALYGKLGKREDVLHFEIKVE